jgi:hypothetical protein
MMGIMSPRQWETPGFVVPEKSKQNEGAVS